MSSCLACVERRRQNLARVGKRDHVGAGQLAQVPDDRGIEREVAPADDAGRTQQLFAFPGPQRAGGDGQRDGCRHRRGDERQQHEGDDDAVVKSKSGHGIRIRRSALRMPCGSRG